MLNVQVTGAARLYHAASVLTIRLAPFMGTAVRVRYLTDRQRIPQQLVAQLSNEKEDSNDVLPHVSVDSKKA